MSTLAFDGRFMATDTQGTGAFVHYDCKKLKIIPASDHCPLSIVAACGIESLHQLMWEWIADGMPDDRRPSRVPDGNTIGMVWQDSDPEFFYVDEHGYACPTPPPFSLGSGSAFAMGAMAAGKNAKEAIRIAAHLDENTGGRIEFVDITAAKPTIKTLKL